MESAIPMSNNNSGLLRVVSNADMVQQERADAKKAAEDKNNSPVLQGLSGHVMGCWEAARGAKTKITERLLKAQRARAGKYDPEKEAAITQFGGSREYARITDNKCRIAESWLLDVYLGQTDRPWKLEPGPIPELPEDLQAKVKQQVGAEIANAMIVTGQPPDSTGVQELTNGLVDAEKERADEVARQTVGRMEAKMADQMLEGGWHTAWAEFLNDITTYPAAHFKAPILRRKSSLRWVNEGGAWVPKVEEGVKLFFERLDPFRVYPAPGITNPQEGYVCIHLPYSRDDLYSLIGVPGFDEAAIRAVLDEYGRGGLTDWMGITPETQKQAINDVPVYGKATNSVTIDCLEFHGPVRGRDLLEWDTAGLFKDKVDDPDKDYEAVVWLVGHWVIKAQLNPDPLRQRPIYKASYKSIPGAYWGDGLPDLLDDVQGVVNAAVRSLVNNMAMASGPQVGINIDRLPPGVDMTQLHPWMIHQFQSDPYGNSNDKPIDFFQPQSNVQDLMLVLNRFYELADDFSMVPRMMAGQAPTGGVGRSASGMSMLMNTANKGLKGVVSAIDTNVLTPMLTALYNYNMLFDPDTSIKGDANVAASGATSLMQLESLQLRRNEFLQATANPIDSQIVGPEGRAEILREVAKGLDIDVNRIIPSRAKLQQMQENQMLAQAAGQTPEGNQEQLQNGAAVTDNFAPNKMRSPV